MTFTRTLADRIAGKRRAASVDHVVYPNGAWFQFWTCPRCENKMAPSTKAAHERRCG